MDLTSLSLWEAAQLIAQHDLSPVIYTRACLVRAAHLDPLFNTFITLTPDLAVEQAMRAEEELSNGTYRGLLHGIPIGLKDLFETEGILTTAGAKLYADYMPKRDGAVVQKLKAAGAGLAGKLNMHELALGVINDNPHYGDCKNPWSPDHITGGSSGGSAAALAARLVPGALGSDTRGSIRIPSALCGVVGLKPTQGRVSLRGVIPLSWNLDHAGPMARTVRDVAILLQAIAGYDDDDPRSVDVPVPDYLAEIDGGVAGWRVAVATDDHFANANAEIIAALRKAVNVFADLGAEVTAVDLSWLHPAGRSTALVTASDATAYYRERLRNQPQDFGIEIFNRLKRDAAHTAPEYAEAQQLHVRLRHRFQRFMRDYDILLTPTTPITAVVRGDPDQVEMARAVLSRFTAPFNMAGVPALSLPCGFSEAGLPLGLQIVGRAWNEAAVLRAGLAYESATDWHKRSVEL